MTVITMYRGDTKQLTIQVKRNNAPLPITGMTMWLTAKRNISDTDVSAVFQLVSPTEIEFTNASAGIARATIQPSDTVNLGDEIVDLACDIQIKDTTNAIRTIHRFTLRVSPDITRTTT